MEQIDWSKAPEGATHYLPRGVAGNNACWYIIRGNDMAVMRAGVDNDGWTWRRIDEYDRERFIPAAIQRPIIWSGTGLPPIGTVCEAYFNGGWRRVEVFAHKREGDTVDVLFTHTKDSGADGWYWLKDAARFRTIRTPEQIAAEERERYITRMWSTIVTERDDDVAVQRKACADLYDAGLRFPEPK